MIAIVFRWAWVLALLPSAACRSAVGFACIDDGDCTGGHCESAGWCSFDDVTCPSGRRYGKWAADGLAGVCVDEPVAETSMGPSATTGGTAPVDGSESTAGPGESSTMAAATTTGDGESTSGESTGGPPQPALVAWYPCEEIQGRGLIADAAGDHPARCVGSECPAVGQGRIGGALHFDGVDDIVRIPHDAGLDLGDAWTVTAWVQPIVVDGAGFQNILGKPVAADAYLDSIELAIPQPGVLVLTTSTALESATIWHEQVLLDNEWVHLAGTSDGETLRLYLDGALLAEAPALPTAYSALDWTVGSGIDMGIAGDFYLGAIDELRLYRGALDPGEIAALAGVP